MRYMYLQTPTNLGKERSNQLISSLSNVCIMHKCRSGEIASVHMCMLAEHIYGAQSVQHDYVYLTGTNEAIEDWGW